MSALAPNAIYEGDIKERREDDLRFFKLSSEILKGPVHPPWPPATITHIPEGIRLSTITNYLTIDVEEHFQVAAFENVIQPSSWESHPSRVENNTHVILDLLDRYRTKATFFIVGWTAERHPELVREIARRGHLIGCHSYLHQKIYHLTPEEFRQDTAKAKDILEQITGAAVKGYRAPSYSITKKSLWAVHILYELGFTYDSSVFPIIHDNYGIPDAPRHPFTWDINGERPTYGASGTNQAGTLTEYPISTAKLLGRNIPVAGGGYFRLFPYWFTKAMLDKINRQENRPFIFYLHPWEVDPEQPRIKNAKVLSKFRHYNNLKKTAPRLERLLGDFSFGPLGEGR